MNNIFILISLLCLLSIITDPLYSQENRRPKVGVVLSGGGAKGIAHVGVLEVLEEAGLKIDFIGGTSMGSIVGGLYAIGYNADSLHNIVLTRDWDYLLSDDISRRDISIEEKPDNDRFFVSFALRERKVALPAGVVTGQNIENQFAELCSHIYHIRDFNRFQIPYLCVATEVETGKEVVFREGNLAACMRASMAIPSVFTPMNIDGKLYIDGGVVNNFPVDHVESMGADILIGVDVGFTPKTAKDDLNLVQILEQTVFMASQTLLENNKEKCDIYIKPDLRGYNASSFSGGDSLIARGKKAAMAYFYRFKSLADSLNEIEYIPYEQPSYVPRDSMLLREIRVNGIKNVSGQLITGTLNLNVLDKVTPAQISRAISHVYSSLFFEKVTYELEPMEEGLLGEGVRLKIKVKEREGGQLKVGLNYNNAYKASITLNTTFRNLLLNGSRTSLNIALGENPYLLGRFEKNNGWIPGFVIEAGAEDMNLNLFDEGLRYGLIDYSDIFGRIFLHSTINNSYAFGLGTEFERIVLKPEIGASLPDVVTNHYYNLVGFIDFDTYDNRFFPRMGTKMEAVYKFIKSPISEPHHFLRFNFEQAASFGPRSTLIPRIYGGTTSADSSLQVYHFYLGGLNRESRKGLLPFVGLDFMERSGRNAWALGMDFQYNIWRSNYLIFRANVANVSREPEDLLVLEDAFSGFGLTLGTQSLIGPIEITLMRPSYRKELIFYVNLGYYF